MTHDDNDQVIFKPEQKGQPGTSDGKTDSWHVLIVDDDEEVHHVTRLALSRLTVLGKPLQLHHASSAAECLLALDTRDDFAVILIDVVMESENAGLTAVRHIREIMERHEVRIILRTGQPGYAPEESVVRDYDINDYKTKSELTHSALTTVMISSIRSYQQIRTINQNRLGLQKIISASSSLMEQQSMQEFSEGVITQISSLLGLRADGLLCARAQLDDDETKKDVYVMGAAGSYAPYIRRKLDSIKNAHITDLIYTCLRQQKHLYTATESVLYLGNENHKAAVYLQTRSAISEQDKALLQVFLTNINVGYENVSLFQRLRNTAYIDPLTRLANRNEFTRLLETQQDSEEARLVAVLIDIDHFSDVNDGLGQEIGNELLIAVASRLKTAYGDHGVVARVDADVFGIIGEEFNLTPRSILAIFESPFSTRDQVLTVNATIGIGRVRELGNHGLTMLKRVYIALNSAKKDNTRHFDYYAQAMEEEKEERLQMIRQLRIDFALQKLRIWYQPQYDLHTRRIVGLEALLRWPQADGSFISPAVFIPIAEYSGLIVSIGAWVLDSVCAQIAMFKVAGIKDMRIAVNVSMPQFRSPLFVSHIDHAMKRHGVTHGELELEITESVLMDDPEAIISCLTRLKALGVRISIDDFGTGYSSLSYLRRLPLDKMKVDRSFVRDLALHDGGIIAETIVHLGRKLGLVTTAEGVETVEQEQIMIAMGCQEAQGYYFARPMPLEDLSELLHITQ